jgi:hypothetical protein
MARRLFAPRTGARERSRAQVFVLDFIMGLTILVVATVFFTSYFTSVAQADARTNDRENQRAAADLALDLLVFSTGTPANWTAGTVARLGVMQSPGVLSSAKLAGLAGVPYAAGKNALGLYAYDVNLTVVNATTGVQIAQWPGVAAFTRNESRYPAGAYERSASVNGSVVLVRLKIW